MAERARPILDGLVGKQEVIRLIPDCPSEKLGGNGQVTRRIEKDDVIAGEGNVASGLKISRSRYVPVGHNFAVFYVLSVEKSISSVFISKIIARPLLRKPQRITVRMSLRTKPA
jgi:hypothetical protein